ncbi:MAG: recombinase family protein [Oscillospiraceae bacterium]|nr:recombinase family protein [Oscillospiraceae bacterium]
MENTRKTALYIRVSTDAQYEEGYSVDAQKQKLEQYCKLKDITDYEFYIDGGWSGSNIDRPEIKRLMDEIIGGKVGAVIVYKLDRLSRSQKDTIFMLEEVFNPYNCSFVSLNENFDTTTPYGKAMIGILSVFAQLERENIRERTRMGMYERVKSGYWMGGGRVPFGYDYDANRDILVPNEHAEDVRQIFDLYLQGYSTTALAKMFDVSGDKQITNILDRITYLGKINFCGEIIDGLHEPIIDEQTWNNVQAERQKRSTKGIVTSSYLLTGLIYCGKCGARMRYQKWGKNGLKIYCNSQQHSRPEFVVDPDCDNLKLDACDVEDIVIKDLFNYTKQNRRIDTEINVKASALQTLKQKYDVVSGRIKRLYNLYAASEDDLLLETINENKNELAEISRQIENEKKLSAVVNDLNEKNKTIATIEDSWDSMSIKDKQKAIRICIDRIEISDTNISIKYAF